MSARDALAEMLERDSAALTDTMTLRELASDSFRLIEIVMTLQERLDSVVTQDDLVGVKTVGDLIAVFDRKGS